MDWEVQVRRNHSFRLFGAWCLFLGTIAVGVSGVGVETAGATGLGNCTTSTYPSVWPKAANYPVQYGQNFDVSSLPTGWYTFAGRFNSNTWRDPDRVTFGGSSYTSLLNEADASGESSPPDESSVEGPINTGGIGNGNAGGTLDTGPSSQTGYYSWCARFTNNTGIDTAMGVSIDGGGLPPELDLVETGDSGTGNNVHPIMHWIGHDPDNDGDQHYNDSGDGGNGTICTEYGGSCKAVFSLVNVTVGSWNQYDVSWTSSAVKLYVNGTLKTTVTDASCATAVGLSGDTSEPCFPTTGSNYQWWMQQISNDGSSTTADNSGLAWWGAYYFQACPPHCA